MIPDFPGWAVGGVRSLRAYDPGHDIIALRRATSDGDLLELGSNESPYGPSERAVAAAMVSLGNLQRYPDPLGSDLRSALSRHHGLAPDNFMLGNGSHELLMQVAQVFAGPAAGVVASQFGFAVYPIAAQAADAPFHAVPALAADADMPRGHDLDALAAAAAGPCRVIYLANPNNPTGTWFTTDALARFLQQVGPERLVVVDEAYAEYVTDPAWSSAIGLTASHPNLLVTRTFSKAHGLASLRVGYACGHPGLLAVLERVRESFNVNGPALAAAEAALEDRGHVAAVCAGNALERHWLRSELLSRGWAVTPSQANFLLVDFGRDASPVEAGLLAQAVVPRPMRGYGLPDCLRLTLGMRPDNARLLAALDLAWQGRTQ